MEFTHMVTGGLVDHLVKSLLGSAPVHGIRVGNEPTAEEDADDRRENEKGDGEASTEGDRSTGRIGVRPAGATPCRRRGPCPEGYLASVEAKAPRSATKSPAATADRLLKNLDEASCRWFALLPGPFTKPIVQPRRDSHLKGWDVGGLVLPIGDHPVRGGRTNRLRLVEIGWWLGHRDLLTFGLWGRS